VVRFSPIARRLFLRRAAGASAAALGVMGGAALVGGCSYSDVSSYTCSSSYCNGCGRNYYHSDGSYCNYVNYSDGC
jgi:hypothetical protein